MRPLIRDMLVDVDGRVVYCKVPIGKNLEETYIESAYFVDNGEELSFEQVAILQYKYDRELDILHLDALEELTNE